MHYTEGIFGWNAVPLTQEQKDAMSWFSIWTYYFDLDHNSSIKPDSELMKWLPQIRAIEFAFYAAFSCLWAVILLSMASYCVEARYFHFRDQYKVINHGRHIFMFKLIQIMKIFAFVVCILASVTWVTYIKTIWSGAVVLAAPLMQA